MVGATPAAVVRAGSKPGHQIRALHSEMWEEHRHHLKEARQAGYRDQPPHPVPLHLTATSLLWLLTLMAENKEIVNSLKMSLKKEGSDQISKVFFNAKELITLGISEWLYSIRRSHTGGIFYPGPATSTPAVCWFSRYIHQTQTTLDDYSFELDLERQCIRFSD